LSNGLQAGLNDQIGRQGAVKGTSSAKASIAFQQLVFTLAPFDGELYIKHN
jgi:hypothetical protein